MYEKFSIATAFDVLAADRASNSYIIDQSRNPETRDHSPHDLIACLDLLLIQGPYLYNTKGTGAINALKQAMMVRVYGTPMFL